MILEQFYLACLAHASYIIIDERTHSAVVVDPQRDVGQYLDAATRHGATITHVFLTHFHADFLAGHLELRERVGARLVLGAKAAAEYDFHPMADGDSLELGDVRLSVLETPGHTPESISILVFDLLKSTDAPEAVLTGDTLFIGDVGRPDLMASVGVTADELAGWLYDSLHEKLLKLPDATIVYPAHGAGSMCGKNLSSETFSTIGEQRAHNYALQPMSKAEFKAVVTADQPTVPAYFGYDAELNKKERNTLEANLERVLRPVTLEQVLTHQNAGVCVLDVRSAAAFAAGHLAGCLNIGLGGKFATWAGTVIPPGTKILLIAAPGTEQEAAMRLGRIGFDDVLGYLADGAEAFAARPELVAATRRVTPAVIAERLAAGNGPVVVDVRGPGEWDAGHIASSLNVPLPELAQRTDEIPRGREVALICKSGYRSSLATSLLMEKGFTDLRDIQGGMDAWSAGALPTVVPAATAGSSSPA